MSNQIFFLIIFVLYLVNIQGILERIHKLNFLASVEASNDIFFPRVKRRLLQKEEENETTFKVCGD